MSHPIQDAIDAINERDQTITTLKAENERLADRLRKLQVAAQEQGVKDGNQIARLERAIAEPAGGATHRHKKRGTEYVLIGIGKMQADSWYVDEGSVSNPDFCAADMRDVAIYRSAIDPTEMWVRPREEFEDGRFEALTTDPAAPEGELPYMCDACTKGDGGTCRCYPAPEGRQEAVRIGDAVLDWMVKFDLLDAGNEYYVSDVLAVLNDLTPSTRPAEQAVTAADKIIREIEERFPNWRSYRDLIDCIDVTLAELRRWAR